MVERKRSLQPSVGSLQLLVAGLTCDPVAAKSDLLDAGPWMAGGDAHTFDGLENPVWTPQSCCAVMPVGLRELAGNAVGKRLVSEVAAVGANCAAG